VKRFLLLMLLAASCGDDAMEAMDAGMCAADCPACGAGETCVRGDGDHLGACLKPCAVPADCASPLRCTQLFGRPDWLCASTTVPERCSTGAFTSSCSDLNPFCYDATTLAQGFNTLSNATCGFTLMPCAHSCDPGGAGGVDAGPATQPHCR
jgi:hypothetical protein